MSTNIPGGANFSASPLPNQSIQYANHTFTTIPMGSIQANQYGGYGGTVGSSINNLSGSVAPGSFGMGAAAATGTYGSGDARGSLVDSLQELSSIPR